MTRNKHIILPSDANVSVCFRAQREQRGDCIAVRKCLRLYIKFNQMIDRNHKFSERSFQPACNIPGNLRTGNSDHKGALIAYISSILYKICRFHGSILLSLYVSYSTRSYAPFKFDSGVIHLNQSQLFATHLFRPQITSNCYFELSKPGVHGISLFYMICNKEPTLLKSLFYPTRKPALWSFAHVLRISFTRA